MPRRARKPKRDELPPKPEGWEEILVVLEGGPRDRFWYGEQAWLRLRRSAERMHATDGVMLYRPTRAHRGHPNYAAAGKVWRFSPQQAVSR